MSTRSKRAYILRGEASEGTKAWSVTDRSGNIIMAARSNHNGCLNSFGLVGVAKYYGPAASTRNQNIAVMEDFDGPHESKKPIVRLGNDKLLSPRFLVSASVRQPYNNLLFRVIVT